jgi:hypothetical protein
MEIYYFRLVRKEYVTLWGHYVICINTKEDEPNYKRDTTLYKSKTYKQKGWGERAVRHFEKLMGNGEGTQLENRNDIVYIHSSDYDYNFILSEWNRIK